ncbi:hypothetical protein ACFL3H_02925 [Gemmatimonadota bacterium]
MRVLRTVSAIALVVAFTVGCSESTSSDDDITIGDLVGTWVAQSMVYTAVGNPAQQYDLVADGGGSMTMVIGADGTFTGTTILPDVMTREYTGTFTVVNTTLMQDFDEEGIPTLTWTITAFADNSMTIGGAQGPWDFSDDQVFNPVTTSSINAVMTRQ